ncbi:hypothetical protein ACQEU6_45140 [Spirillospora sp. CA-108201]
MPRIAISGHRGMPTDSERVVDAAIRQLLASQQDVTGLSCLADGPDQLFARAVLDQGGAIEAVIPAHGYREGLPQGAHSEYDRLLSQAVEVHRLDFTESNSEAHMAASALMIDLADELWAVWDGLPARGYGGTADVVAYARERRIPLQLIWPDGARRD